MGHRFRLVDSETVDVTHALAVKFSQMPASTTERDLKAKRLEYLKDAMLNGTAIAFCWAQAKIAETGETVRVNGNHSSNMLAKLNGQIPAGLKAHIDTYEVDTKGDLVGLFRQIDSRLSSRSVDDISGAYQGLHEDLADVPKGAARKAVEGAVWYKKNKIGDDVPNGDDRFALFNDAKLHPFYQMVGRILSVKTPEFTTPVIGAMFGAWERDVQDAETFFINVAKQGSGDSTSPAATLDAWLVEGRMADEKPKEQEVYAACALAWNAFRNHRTLDKIGRYSKKKGAPELD